MIKIICIGNRFAYPDNFGILIYEELKTLFLDDITLIEGGVGGDSLALHFEDDAKILIVDYATDDMPKIISNKDIQKLEIKEYNHANSLLYFLTTVQKEYKLYLCSDKFDPENIKPYIDDILKIARSI